MSFKRFETSDIVISNDVITAAAWSTNSPTLTSFFTSSVQKNGSSGDFYLSIYQVDPVTSASPPVTVSFEAWVSWPMPTLPAEGSIVTNFDGDPV